ncbi:MAG: 30S ribosomal protein S12 methylthiotransferase RimO [Ruminococcaceae bacterium]|nr:30S ribosomal protein S12 methylthiotransferase RimO [Oscillospiraceae bacterium]
MSIKVGFVSLGCPKNTCDTEVMLGLINEAGMEIVEEDIYADVMVINTCAFIQSAKEEAIETILDVNYLKEHHNLKGIVVTGCLATRYAKDIEKNLPEVDAILSAGDEGKICEAVEAAYRGEKYISFSPTENLAFGGDRVVTTPEYTAYLKIAEGCDNRCAYCSIPNIRGKFRSREEEDIVAEAHTLFDLGVRELCLVAQDTTRWGLDLYGEYRLDKLVERLATEEGLGFKWIRLLYCYPDKITDSLIDVMAKYKNVAKYIDMPIQHINDRVLSVMNRHGGSEVIKSAVRRLRAKMPDITIRTTVITGFPTETAEEFYEMLDFVKETRFSRLGAFPYSREEGTPAYDMKQVSVKNREKRADAIMEAQHDIHAENNEKLIGKTIEVLSEGYDPVAETYFGRSEMDAPDIDSKVYFSAKRRIRDGEFIKVEITGSLDYDLIGKQI